MKKALNLTTLIAGIVATVMGFLGIIAFILNIVEAKGFNTALILNLVIILAQIAVAIAMIKVAKKENAMYSLIFAIVALVLIILDLFVLRTMASIKLAGYTFAVLAISEAILTIFDVIGYILMVAYIVVVALSVLDMVTKK